MFRFSKTGEIIRESDGACIPPDSKNKDYADLMLSIALGAPTVITPYVPPPIVDLESTDSKLETMKAALITAGVLTKEQLERKGP